MGQERLRRVTESDKEQLFVWTNDPVTRMQSFSQEPVSWENHCAWFEKKLHDPDCYHYILEVDGEVAGVIRLDLYETECLDKCSVPEQKKAYRISYSVSPQMRGHGYGRKLLQLAEYHAAVEIADCGALIGEVKKENTASVRCFEACGYWEAEENKTPQSVEELRERCFIKRIEPGKCVYFRADAGNTIGNGHMMRCLTIADACREEGMYPVFLTADETPLTMIEARGYLAHVLGTDYRAMEQELPVYGGIVPVGAVIVIDSYFVTEQYVGELKKQGYRLGWLDDLGELILPVDLLMNYNLYADELGYEKRTTERIKYLLGAAYAPVRPAFSKNVYEVRKEWKRILITTGASDPYHAGVLFAKALAWADATQEIDVVCGTYCEDIEKLLELSTELEKSGKARVRLLRDLTDLSDAMYESDLAIAAAGSTLYELCAVGVPTLVYDFADNQKQGAEAFARRTGSVYLGDLRTQADKAAQNAVKSVKQLALYSERKRLSECMKQLSDGNGAIRIAKALKQLADMKEEA